jgi:hypothetical protein
MSRDLRWYNPSLDKHEELKDKVLDIVNSTGRIETPDILDEVKNDFKEKNDWSPQYIRNMLSDIRVVLEDEDKIRTEENPEGGQPTFVWVKK